MEGEPSHRGYAVGRHSWKRYQLPPDVKLWEARVDERGGLSDLAEADARGLGVRLNGLDLGSRDGGFLHQPGDLETERPPSTRSLLV